MHRSNRRLLAWDTSSQSCYTFLIRNTSPPRVNLESPYLLRSACSMQCIPGTSSLASFILRGRGLHTLSQQDVARPSMMMTPFPFLSFFLPSFLRYVSLAFYHENLGYLAHEPPPAPPPPPPAAFFFFALPFLLLRSRGLSVVMPALHTSAYRSKKAGRASASTTVDSFTFSFRRSLDLPLVARTRTGMGCGGCRSGNIVSLVASGRGWSWDTVCLFVCLLVG